MSLLKNIVSAIFWLVLGCIVGRLVQMTAVGRSVTLWLSQAAAQGLSWCLEFVHLAVDDMHKEKERLAQGKGTDLFSFLKGKKDKDDQPKADAS